MSEVSTNVETEKFYKDAADYWQEIPATVEGMLGGFGFISQTDIRSSRMLLKQLFSSKTPPDRNYAIDCGAGIGRITKYLLSNFFEKVDLVEQNPLFLEKANAYLGTNLIENKIGKLFNEGLQNFEFAEKKYDVIWVQWVLGHLTDDHFIKFLKSGCNGLKQNGVIVIKENVTSTGEIEVDKNDSSVTRPLSVFRQIFEKVGLDCCRLVKQNNFPKGLYTVYTFVLRYKPLDSEFESVKLMSVDDVSNE